MEANKQEPVKLALVISTAKFSKVYNSFKNKKIDAYKFNINK